ncbi:MAG: PEP-CTERM sorting domain-containing protein [Opitutaceae bacterium]
MKNTLKILAAALAVSSTSLSAQSMLAGWDFSSYAFDGFSSVDGVTLVGSVDANYAGGVANFSGGAAVGTLYYDGQFGSSAFDLGASQITPQGVGDTAVNNLGYLGTLGSRTALSGQGQAYNSGRALGFDTNGAYVFALNLGGSYDMSSFTYAAYNSNDASSAIAWEWSTDGSSYIELEADVIGISSTAYSVDLSAIDGVTQLYVRGTLSDLSSNLSYIDNVSFNGTAVPEPSTYAMIFGFVALGFTAYRRRNVKA